MLFISSLAQEFTESETKYFLRLTIYFEDIVIPFTIVRILDGSTVVSANFNRKSGILGVEVKAVTGSGGILHSALYFKVEGIRDQSLFSAKHAFSTENVECANTYTFDCNLLLVRMCETGQFLDLPIETRYQIYEAIFTNPSTIFVKYADGGAACVILTESDCSYVPVNLYLEVVSTEHSSSRNTAARSIVFAPKSLISTSFRIPTSYGKAVWKHLIALAGVSKQIQSEVCYVFWRLFNIEIYARDWIDTRNGRFMLRSLEPVDYLLDRLSLGMLSGEKFTHAGLLNGLRHIIIKPTRRDVKDLETTEITPDKARARQVERSWRRVWTALTTLQTKLNRSRAPLLPEIRVHWLLDVCYASMNWFVTWDFDNPEQWYYATLTMKLPVPHQTARMQEIEEIVANTLEEWHLDGTSESWTGKIPSDENGVQLEPCFRHLERVLDRWLDKMKSYAQKRDTMKG